MGGDFLIEVDTQKMGNFVHPPLPMRPDYVRLAIGAPGTHACLMSVAAILTGLRYAEDVPPTAIT